MDKSANSKSGILVYGGTFNPVHIGHLRLAIEARAKLGSLVSQIDFVPNATPPHKKAQGILPYSLRTRLLEAALPKNAPMRCNDLEARRAGPSYTYDTLLEYREIFPHTPIFFLLGSQDYALLPSWKRGLELPELCHLAVAPRNGFLQQDFFGMTQKLWPDNIKGLNYEDNGLASAQLHKGEKIYYLDIPQLEISASRIRAIWLSGGNVDFLTPAPVLEILEKEKKTVTACWQENGLEC